MKRLHLYILKSFVGPLFVTLIISLFVLLMQFLWVYLDELVGKGLDTGIIIEFLIYALAMLMPMALPLSMLLASIMTFGELGENNELLAMKAAGISLFRIMKPVIVLSVVISIGAFTFSNNVIPVSYKKLIALMSSIRQLRPEIVVKEGVFSNEIDGFSIKVGHKSKSNEMLYDIMIYDHRNDQGNLQVTVADSGTMKISKDKKYMILNLYSGGTHLEVEQENRTRSNYPSRTDKFDRQTIFIMLQGMELERKDESFFRNQFKALKNEQIVYFVDSLSKKIDIQRDEQVLSLSFPSPVSTNLALLTRKDSTIRRADIHLKKYVDIDSIVTHTDPSRRLGIISGALGQARNNAQVVKQSAENLTSSVRSVNRFGIEWHKKYTYSIACLIFFFIGAPLGAIIRKGGLGMPLVVSVILFIFYWIISTTGEKFARESVSALWEGVWFSTFVFIPAGIFLTYKAVTDSAVFNIDVYTSFFRKLLFWKKIKQEEVSETRQDNSKTEVNV